MQLFTNLSLCEILKYFTYIMHAYYFSKASSKLLVGF